MYQQGQYQQALDEFTRAVALRERGYDAVATREAWWMVAWTQRAMKRNDEALAIQLRLEQENDAAGVPDPDVFEELEMLYRDMGDDARARFYAGRRRFVTATGQ